MNNIKKSLGKNVKFYREQNNLTQEELAEKASLNFRSISLIERGINFVTAESLEKICSALNVSCKQLFNFELNKEKPNKKFILNLLTKNENELKKIYLVLKEFFD